MTRDLPSMPLTYTGGLPNFWGFLRESPSPFSSPRNRGSAISNSSDRTIHRQLFSIEILPKNVGIHSRFCEILYITSLWGCNLTAVSAPKPSILCQFPCVTACCATWHTACSSSPQHSKRLASRGGRNSTSTVVPVSGVRSKKGACTSPLFILSTTLPLSSSFSLKF